MNRSSLEKTLLLYWSENFRDPSQFKITNLLRHMMPEIEIITPLDKILFHVFLSISIMTLHCYLCDMSKLLEVDLNIFWIYMLSSLQKCDRHPQANWPRSYMKKKNFLFYSMRKVSVNELCFKNHTGWKCLNKNFSASDFFIFRTNTVFKSII